MGGLKITIEWSKKSGKYDARDSKRPPRYSSLMSVRTFQKWSATHAMVTVTLHGTVLIEGRAFLSRFVLASVGPSRFSRFSSSVLKQHRHSRRSGSRSPRRRSRSRDRDRHHGRYSRSNSRSRSRSSPPKRGYLRIMIIIVISEGIHQDLTIHQIEKEGVKVIQRTAEA